MKPPLSLHGARLRYGVCCQTFACVMPLLNDHFQAHFQSYLRSGLSRLSLAIAITNTLWRAQRSFWCTSGSEVPWTQSSNLINRYILATLYVSLTLVINVEGFIKHADNGDNARDDTIEYLADLAHPLQRAEELTYVSLVILFWPPTEFNVAECHRLSWGTWFRSGVASWF